MRRGESICSMNRTDTASCVCAPEFAEEGEPPMIALLFAIESPTIIVLVVAAIFLLFGGSKLPQLARALGQSKKAFKEGIDDASRDDRTERSKLESVDDETL